MSSPCCTRARAPDPCWIATAQSLSSTATTNYWPRHWPAGLGLPFSMWWIPHRQHLSLAVGSVTMCSAISKRWSTSSKQVSLAAWSSWTLARHMIASAAHGSSSACPAWALARMLASGSASCCKTLQPRQNTSASAAFNGWQSASFPERSGVQQGSPLSPLLYVLGAQPLASHLRQQARLGIVRPISMPNGQPAPISHQHADDTSLHVLQPSDAQMAIDSSIALFCAASCSRLNANKSQGFLVQAQPLSSATVSALPGISFITGQQTVKHLGVRLGYDMQAACHQTFTGIYHAIKAMVCHWSARGLSFLGRVHVAKQVLAASLWYHATFQRPSEQLLNQISSQLRNYVATTQQSSHKLDKGCKCWSAARSTAFEPLRWKLVVIEA